MQAIALDPDAKRVLRALYELAELDRPASAGAIGRALEMRALDVGRALLALDHQGLAVAERARLTLRGLAVAVRLPSLQLAEHPERLSGPRLARALSHAPLLHQRRA